MMKRIAFLLAFGVAASLFAFPGSGLSLEANLTGQIESKFVMRDESGFQYGFMDDLRGVQWRQELQLDLELQPRYDMGRPQFRFDKAFFRYRGAYDAIFDLTDRYDEIRERSVSDFEPGLQDLRFEDNLREAYVDFVGWSGGSRGLLRMGRQIIQWGEADGFNLMNVVNPMDNSNQMFFADPEDLAFPLWMARFDINTPGIGPFREYSLQLLGVPDIRPNQFAPLDGMYNAPYAFAFAGFSPLPVVIDVESRTLSNMEWGARLGTRLYNWDLFLYYYDGHQKNPAIDFSTAATEGVFTFRYPEQKTYGYSFNTFVPAGNFMFRGEGSITKDYTVLNFEDPRGRGYTHHDFYQGLFAIDRAFSRVVPGTFSALTTGVQAYYYYIDDYDEDPLFGRTTPEDSWRFTLFLTTDFWRGRIVPSFFVMYDIEDAWLTSVGVDYSPDGKWYFGVSQISFWGDRRGDSPFAPLIDTASEVAVKAGYRF